MSMLNDALKAAPELKAGRREFLKTAALGTIALTTGGVAVASWREEDTLTVRRDITTLANDSDMIQALKEGVAKMRERSDKSPLDPLGWQIQGSTHAIFCSDADVSVQVHYGWYFLPWHRAYLWTLEEKIRRLTGYREFALPYWDWTKYPRIPEVYFGDENPLNDNSRIYGAGDEIPADFLDLRGILSSKIFHNFGGYNSSDPTIPKIEGLLENSSHNNVHNWIGGNMASFSGAGFDPIFYSHHNMIDRIWDAWKAADPEGNKDPIDREFLDYQFQFFGASGDIESMKVGDLLSSAALGYTWDNLEVNYTLDDRDSPKFDASLNPTFTTELDVSEDQLATIKAMGDGGEGRRVLLQFERIQLPIHPLCVRVFLNRPDAGQETAADGPAFAGTFTFLPIGADGGVLETLVSLQLDVSKQIGSLLKDGNRLSVTLVPVPLKGREIPLASLTPRGVTLQVDV